jgi:hypothetical protein
MKVTMAYKELSLLLTIKIEQGLELASTGQTCMGWSD